MGGRSAKPSISPKQRGEFSAIMQPIRKGTLVKQDRAQTSYCPSPLPDEQVAHRQWLAGEPRLSRLEDGAVRVVAPAKINLTLWVGPRRDDGYHPLESIIAQISLVDRLTVKNAPKGLELTCSQAGLACDETNIVVQAAQMLAKRANHPANLRIYLEKSIPIGAGLGGGSSDAAACLLALNNLWTLGYNNQELAQIGAQLGSDVPLFLHSPISIMRGRGELVESAGFNWPFWALVVAPDEQISTAQVYHKFDELLTKAGDADRIDLQRLGLCAPEEAGSVMFNMLTEAALAMLPRLAQLQEQLRQAGAKTVRISGSGSALVCLFNSLNRARCVVNRLGPQLQARTWIVHGGHL